MQQRFQETAHQHGVQGVGSSNLLAPTNIIKDLQRTAVCKHITVYKTKANLFSAFALISYILFAGVLTVYGGDANAGEVALLAGMSHFTPAPDGIWYQQPFPHELKLNSGSYGLRYDTDQYWHGESFAIGYMNLGTVTSWSLSNPRDALTANDGGYDHISKQCNGECWPLASWNGRGTVQGIFAAVTQHYGGFSADLGMYVYRPTFVMHIPDFMECRTCKRYDLTVQHNPRIKVGLMMGVGYQYGHESIRVSVWPTSTAGDEFPAVYDKWTYNVSVGRSF